MYCSKCGALLHESKFCPVCKEKVRSQAELFRMEERRRRNRFCKNHTDNVPYYIAPAEACWYLILGKLELKPFVSNDGKVRPDAHKDLARVEKLALKLFDRMKGEVDRVLAEEKEETK